jgi:phage shock protein PspC (stress-responsive transcriptional regulator)
MTDTKRCPYCAETIRAEAVRCRYCRSRLVTFEQERWHRGHGDARIAGVASAIARAMSLPLPLVRLGFVVLTIVHLVGLVLYVALWLVIPPAPGDPSVLERWLETMQGWVRRAGGRDRGTGSHEARSVEAPARD